MVRVRRKARASWRTACRAVRAATTPQMRSRPNIIDLEPPMEVSEVSRWASTMRYPECKGRLRWHLTTPESLVRLPVTLALSRQPAYGLAREAQEGVSPMLRKMVRLSFLLALGAVCAAAQGNPPAVDRALSPHDVYCSGMMTIEAIP